MCQREGLSLQRGMNYAVGGRHSVILMSLRSNAPYRDQLEDDGSTLTYEGHDQPRRLGLSDDPKKLDQLEFTETKRLTPNGLFHRAAQDYKAGRRPPERVRVYEKIKDGIWSYNGVFHLIDSWQERDEFRSVFKFRLVTVEADDALSTPTTADIEHRRVIPTWVKLEVWKRDGGKCVRCGATNNLHFDHDLPFSKGGTSLSPGNVQLLCVRHNLGKRDQIV